ncbi:MAG TPA: amidase [Xanthobacteraceae bacterium]|nr:amidase [Xanthobacteraceae bacterium]
MRTLNQIAARLEAGEPSLTLIDQCLDRIKDPAGEGGRTFLKVYGERARTTAEAFDALRRHGGAPSRFAGIPISIKDLFDVAGDVTTAGSMALRQAPAAARDAGAITRLRTAGFIPIGRTNMTEFAFSGLGINPHYDTPRNPYDRKTGRIPGGSSSGAAVSVTDGMAPAALGTDTGGSCRIPAALTGIAGFKPTASRVPVDGVMPLSQSLDSVGVMAPTVACCAVVDAVLAGGAPAGPAAFPLAGLRLAVPQTVVLDGLDPDVSRAFSAALTALGGAGARITELAVREFEELAQVNAKGGFVCAEAYAVHRPLIKAKAKEYDPFVLARIERGKEQDAADYIELMWARADMIGRLNGITAPYDALLMPTVPIVAPTLRELADADTARRTNALLLRNTVIANFFDRCAVSIPCHKAGEAPVGLMLMGENGADRRLLAVAAAVEKLVAPGVAK